MTYETPELLLPEAVYEAPVLVDLEDMTACQFDCGTGGVAPPPE